MRKFSSLVKEEYTIGRGSFVMRTSNLTNFMDLINHVILLPPAQVVSAP